MKKLPVIAIFDVGKTNKKLLLFDQQYRLVFEQSKQFDEIEDEDGFPTEDVTSLTGWLLRSFIYILEDERFDIKALNFSAYGASFVYLDKSSEVTLPLYNYLKPYPAGLRRQFYDLYGGESLFARETASPVLGSLNSGMQLYRLKYEQPKSFANIWIALHLPQYLSFIFSRQPNSDITSIGCHTNLWDFEKAGYHSWVNAEALDTKFAGIADCESVSGYYNQNIPVGIGLHDSSAALIPYLAVVQEPFLLLSTGTWCISLNPFNDQTLTDFELQHDCLCYLTYRGKPIKASRLFAGHEHEEQIKKLALHFGKTDDYFTTVACDELLLSEILKRKPGQDKENTDCVLRPSAFSGRQANEFKTYEEAYHQLIVDLVEQQIVSTQLVLNGTAVKKIFVDGGFGKNSIYMFLLAQAFPDMEVYAASVPQATALGAAMAMHKHWNPLPLSEGNEWEAMSFRKI